MGGFGNLKWRNARITGRNECTGPTRPLSSNNCANQPGHSFVPNEILPDGVTLPGNALSDKKGKDGNKYINGYVDITMGKLPSFAGASVHPEEQPHLISKNTFEASLKSPVKNIVPPNAFRSVANASDRGKTLVNIACSTVGSLTQTKYAASIPHGFIVVYNPSGYKFQGNLPDPNSIFNNQLYSGVFLGDNGAFSTDQDALQAWVDYNNANPKTGPMPSRDGIFSSSGTPISVEEASQIAALGGGVNAYPSEADYTMTSGDGRIPQVAALVPALERAYDATNSKRGSQVELTAVEELKGLVMMMFANRLTGAVHPPTGYSGMRIFDHQAQLPVPAGAPPIISKPGNVKELLNQVGDSAIMPALKKRMLQIKPNASEDEMNRVLTYNQVGLGERYYIFMDANTQELRMSKTPPAWVSKLPKEWQDGTKADGNPVDSMTIFPTLGLSVNPPGESGFNNALFDTNSDPSSTGLATDEAIWKPSSGYNCLLGSLQFREKIQGLEQKEPTPDAPPPLETPSTNPPSTPPTPTPPTTTPSTPPTTTPPPTTPPGTNPPPPPTTPTAPPVTPPAQPPRSPQPVPPPAPVAPPPPKTPGNPAPPSPGNPACTCNPSRCTFPWDAAACKLNFSATIRDVVKMLRASGAKSDFVSYKNRNGTSANLSNMGFRPDVQAAMAWDAAIAVYGSSNGRVDANHSYAGLDLPGMAPMSLTTPASGHFWDAFGSGSGFLKWFNQNSCGKSLIIVDTIN